MVGGSMQECNMTHVWVIVVRMNTYREEAYDLANHQMRIILLHYLITVFLI
jgi:hypothetical protein